MSFAGDGVFVFVACFSDTDVHVIECAADIDTELDGHRAFEHGDMVFETHIKRVLASHGDLVFVHGDHERQDLHFVVVDEQFDGNVVNDILGFLLKSSSFAISAKVSPSSSTRLSPEMCVAA